MFNDLATRAKLRRNLLRGIVSPTLKVFSHRRAVADGQDSAAFPTLPLLLYGLDNIPRGGRHAIVMSTRALKRFYVKPAQLTRGVLHKDPEERVVFVNAWNEWAEGIISSPT